MENGDADNFGGSGPANFGKGECPASLIWMAAIRSLVSMQRVNPADLVLEFLEAALDFPAGGLILDQRFFLSPRQLEQDAGNTETTEHMHLPSIQLPAQFPQKLAVAEPSQ